MISRDDLEARLWEITGRELDGTMIDPLLDLIEACAAAHARDVRDYAEYSQAIRDFQAQRRCDEQSRVDALMFELIHVLAVALEEADDAVCMTCPGCRRALSVRRRNCSHCGAVVPAAQEAQDDESLAGAA
jgi:hypothetical protein